MTDSAWCKRCARVVDGGWCDQCRRPLNGGPSRLELADAAAAPDVLHGTVCSLSGFIRVSGSFNRDVYVTLDDVADGAMQVGEQVEFVIDRQLRSPRQPRAKDSSDSVRPANQKSVSRRFREVVARATERLAREDAEHLEQLRANPMPRRGPRAAR